MRLSVNVDHVATLRNARGGAFPCPVEAARVAVEAGADGITVHLREDRRHIRDRDVERIGAEVATRLNLEMAATEEMVGIACRLRPAACCLVPEKRQELTTEGGLDVLRAGPFLGEACGGWPARASRSRFSSRRRRRRSRLARASAPRRWNCTLGPTPTRRGRARAAPGAAARRGGGGAGGGAALPRRARADLRERRPVAAMPEVVEVSIGHFLIGQSVFEGPAGGGAADAGGDRGGSARRLGRARLPTPRPGPARRRRSCSARLRQVKAPAAGSATLDPSTREEGGMTYAAIIVHVGEEARSRARVSLAAGLAGRFDAALIGVAAEPRAALPAHNVMGAYTAALLTQEERRVEAALAVAERAFRGALPPERASRAEWRRFEEGSAHALAREARSADLLVVSAEVAGDVLTRAGRPVLVPPSGVFSLGARQVVVGWKDAPQARRAVADALPLLLRAEGVAVLRVLRPGASEEEPGPARAGVEEVARFLARHGAPARADTRALGGASVADELVAAARERGADLIVSGGYGHARLREWAFGGVTRDLLSRCPMCCLLSH
jgi:pyridoxine 5-phosphate synthase